MYKGLEQDFSTPETEVEAKPDVFSLAGLIAWLEKQDLAETYCYNAPMSCLLTRYFAEHGFGTTGAGGYFGLLRGKHAAICREMHEIAGYGLRPYSHLNTYADALQRALSLAALQGKG